jgi:hypothetical protein
MSNPFARREESLNITMDDLSVFIGIPAGRDLPILTVKALLRTQALLQERGVPCEVGMVGGCSVVQWARDEVADLFLASSANRMFWIDSDMVWEPGQFVRLLAMSKLHDVVCAAYPAKMEQPTFFINHDKQVGLVRGEHGLVEIYGAGLGFTVVTRDVMEQLAARAYKIHDEISGKDMASIFRIDTEQRGEIFTRRGEDMAFFSDIRAMGYKVWMDPTVDLGHIGAKTYRGNVKDVLTAAPLVAVA